MGKEINMLCIMIFSTRTGRGGEDLEDDEELRLPVYL